LEENTDMLTVSTEQERESFAEKLSEVSERMNLVICIICLGCLMLKLLLASAGAGLVVYGWRRGSSKGISRAP
jgi:hypothetical protein